MAKYRAPRTAKLNIHLWADWVELLCISNSDGVTTEAIVRKRCIEERDGDVEAADALAEELEAEAVAEDDLDVVEDDKLDAEVRGWFGHLKMRAELFGDAYPFIVADDALAVRAEHTATQLLYVALLMMSNLGNFPKKKVQPNLTAGFEWLSLHVFRQLLPANAQTHLFRGSQRYPSEFTGKLWPRLQKLAHVLGEQVKLAEAEVSATNTGDKGLDLIGWLPLPDKAPGRLILFGQCACTEDWTSKQHSISAGRWRNRISLKSNPMSVVFIPFCQRGPEQSWHQHDDMDDTCIFMDRFRLLHLLSATADQFLNLPALQEATSCLADKEEAA